MKGSNETENEGTSPSDWIVVHSHFSLFSDGGRLSICMWTWKDKICREAHNQLFLCIIRPTWRSSGPAFAMGCGHPRERWRRHLRLWSYGYRHDQETVDRVGFFWDLRRAIVKRVKLVRDGSQSVGFETGFRVGPSEKVYNAEIRGLLVTA